MGYATRMVAKAIFGTPPTSTYEQALHCFLRAEEIEVILYYFFFTIRLLCSQDSTAPTHIILEKFMNDWEKEQKPFKNTKPALEHLLLLQMIKPSTSK